MLASSAMSCPFEEGTIAAAAASVKARRLATRNIATACCVWSRGQNERFAFASGLFGLVFRGAVRGCCRRPAEAGAIERQPHALRRDRRALGADGARIDAHPGNLR